ncbi:MAG: hypothetical protein M3P53_01440 [Actinomycetota bacterium]|nr:hypothetical protein [Actinomycetota bacterium]
MDVLIERVVQDAVVAVCRRDGELVVTRDLRAPSVALKSLQGLAQTVCEAPLVVAGWLPEDVTGVRVLWPGDWEEVVVADGAWLGVAVDEPVSEHPTWALAFVCDDGSHEPVPDPGESDGTELEDYRAGLLDGGEVNAEGVVYAAALADAIAADIAQDRLPGPLRRLVVRWFENGDPLYLTIHALADGDPQPEPDDAWYPLEWEANEREFRRTDRVLQRIDVRKVAAALTATFPRDEAGAVDGAAHVPAVIELVRRLPDALAAHEVGASERFAVAAAHFEGWGALHVIEATASEGLRSALEAHGEMPAE